MTSVRIAALIAVLTLAVPAAAARPPAGPVGLKAFLLRADEPAATSFARTPSLAWAPVPGARRYEVQLATSPRFDSGTVVWSSATVRAPAVAIPVSLPWASGSPHALYVHVRAHTRAGLTSWSEPLGFDLEPPAPPQPLPAAAGLVRWTPVAGATGYNVWYPDAGKVFATTTNAADQREFYAFHRDARWTASVRWRVRAVRALYGRAANGLPAVSYGPWSEVYVARNPAASTGALRAASTLSDTVGPARAPRAHGLTPAFAFAGDAGVDGRAHPLFRVYVFTDRRCVNVVYRGAIVGSPAYAPRSTGPLALPASAEELTAAATGFLHDGPEEGATFMADYLGISTNETVRADAETPATGGPAGASASVSGALVDLWDSGWPSGRYTWTVVPVDPYPGPNGVEYRDAELPQDVCAAGRSGSFGKISRPAVTVKAAPFVSGLSPSGRLLAAGHARPSLYGAPLVAWEPAPGALRYEVQVSRTRYPWRPARPPLRTNGTAAVLDGLAPGTWYYRVRGLDPHLPGPVKQMSWSQPVALELTAPTFRIVR